MLSARTKSRRLHVQRAFHVSPLAAKCTSTKHRRVRTSLRRLSTPKPSRPGGRSQQKCSARDPAPPRATNRETGSHRIAAASFSEAPPLVSRRGAKAHFPHPVGSHEAVQIAAPTQPSRPSVCVCALAAFCYRPRKARRPRRGDRGDGGPHGATCHPRR
eukprot:365462-Chlamydomonas_euryale.AAC.2